MKKSLFKASTALLLILSMTACGTGTANYTSQDMHKEAAHKELLFKLV